MGNLEDLLNQQSPIPEGWRPEEGDRLIGKLIDVTEGWSEQSQTNYPILVIHDEEKDQDVSIHCFHHVLKNEVLKHKPQIGEKIGVKFIGKVPLKSNPTHTVATYKFAVEGRQGKANYASFTPSNRGAGDTVSSSGGQNSGDEGDDLPF